MRGTDELALAIGFEDMADLEAQQPRLCAELETGKCRLSRRDWRRTLLATEIIFVSDVVGVGVEWRIMAGLDDVDTLQTLRRLQRKLVHAR